MQKMYFQKPGTCYRLYLFAKDAGFVRMMLSKPRKKDTVTIRAMTHWVIKSSFYNPKSLFLKNKIR